MTTTSAPPTPKPRRRWRQFSLRTVMVLVLAACVSWSEIKVRQPRVQRKTVEQSMPGVHQSLDRSGRSGQIRMRG